MYKLCINYVQNMRFIHILYISTKKQFISLYDLLFSDTFKIKISEYVQNMYKMYKICTEYIMGI